MVQTLSSVDSKNIYLPGKYSVTTDAVVRSVTVTFIFGEKVVENTVGKKKIK